MNVSDRAQQQERMSPFTIKKNKKNTGTVLRLIGGGKPTYKKHRDDEEFLNLTPVQDLILKEESHPLFHPYQSSTNDA